tara:strand:- start:85 stop:807 length:723 start_codon:yes stop_codon:yes gene_type:complete
MKIKDFHSPNFNKKKRLANTIKVIVIHYTGMQSERESLIRLTNPRFKVSSHLLINQSGIVYRMVQDKHIAWHAGKSCWGKYKNLNKNSIGIELVNKGHKFGYTNFKKKQLLSLQNICRKFIKKYKIKKKNIVGHSDIAPSRKIDPGEKFPWEILAKNKIGIWHDCKPHKLKKFRKVKIIEKEKEKFIIYLKKIGYCFNKKNKIFTNKIIKSFQRHYRKELINGIADKESLIIAQNLSKKV